MGARERLPVNNELDILIKFIRITDTMSALVSFFHKKNVNIQALIFSHIPCTKIMKISHSDGIVQEVPAVTLPTHNGSKLGYFPYGLIFFLKKRFGLALCMGKLDL